MLKELDHKDAAILKGIAISAIVFHNFFRLFGPAYENEFSFDSSRFPIFLQQFVHPATAIQAFFTFFGHYGVQVFIFLSAYGLAKTHWDDSEPWSSFMWSRVRKLYPMFLLAIAFWAVLAVIQVGPLWVIKDAAPKLLLMLAGVSTILPGQGFPVIGPWWFIPFIMQFYAIWPLLRKLTKRFGWEGLIALSLACFFLTHFANPTLAHWSINLGATPIGRMKIFCFGIIAARYPIRLNAYVALPSLVLLILANEYDSIAAIASLAAITLFLWLYDKTRILLRRWDLLEQLGKYSLAIFLVNGIVRVPFVAIARTPVSQLLLALSSAATSVVIAVCFHYLLMPDALVVMARKAGRANSDWTPKPETPKPDGFPEPLLSPSGTARKILASTVLEKAPLVERA